MKGLPLPEKSSEIALQMIYVHDLKRDKKLKFFLTASKSGISRRMLEMSSLAWRVSMDVYRALSVHAILTM